MKELGKRLENLRDKKGYTKKELSLKLGFTANVYGSYERGDRNPSLETLAKLADIYNVSLDYLIRGEEFQNTEENQTDIAKLERLCNYFHNKGIEQPFFMQLDKWQLLDNEDLLELSNHFEWVVHKAKKRKENNWSL